MEGLFFWVLDRSDEVGMRTCLGVVKARTLKRLDGAQRIDAELVREMCEKPCDESQEIQKKLIPQSRWCVRDLHLGKRSRVEASWLRGLSLLWRLQWSRVGECASFVFTTRARVPWPHRRSGGIRPGVLFLRQWSILCDDSGVCAFGCEDLWNTRDEDHQCQHQNCQS